MTLSIVLLIIVGRECDPRLKAFWVETSLVKRSRATKSGTESITDDYTPDCVIPVSSSILRPGILINHLHIPRVIPPIVSLDSIASP